MLLLVPALPLAAVLLSWLPLGKRVAPAVTLAATAASFALALASAARVVTNHTLVAIPGWVTLDGLGAVVLLLATGVGALAALYSWGYVGAHGFDAKRTRSYYGHLNLFIFALALVPVLDEPALVWIAVEGTAMFSVLLVAFDNTRGALEAAWKYIALMFLGATIALLGFFVLFWAQQAAGGGHYSWDGLRAIAPQLPVPLTTAAFLLILVGFGAKVGFVPMHTWLPDAHSQAPSPVCALLSGIKTTVVLYTILRLVPLLPAARVDAWLRGTGLLSAGVGALLLLQVRDYKRLFAYSTVEHMGIIAVGAGFGAGAGAYGAVLQMMSHGITKAFCFFAAGAVLLIAGTRDIASVRGLLRKAPLAGAALLFGALAIGGAPPFIVFLSEFSIFRAGLAAHYYVTSGLLAAFITIAFFGILLHVNRMVFGQSVRHGSIPSGPARDRLPFTCALTLVLAAVPVLVLGVYQPPALHTLLSLAASNLAPAVTP